MTRHSDYHDGCGGTVLTGGSGVTAHTYCDSCGAFTHLDEPLPSGTDKSINRAAWDAGDESSPEAEKTR